MKKNNKPKKESRGSVLGVGEMLSGINNRGSGGKGSNGNKQMMSEGNGHLIHSPFREYLTQIENTYGVTSIESVGPGVAHRQGQKEPQLQEQQEQHPASSNSVSDLYAIAVLQD
eukprot:CAMPEP_0178732458 /NCGR_PEP_ID=MMETSP0744-20121128/274_1 /TAXON_ID=913974 /ORGANISM="Nitzschia punctata, Strain CCMP561" /LENGTH=113 /DNA_ID=CAMNT_0020384579 /DNA_START=1755 /DNA_END=2093 /DNA_ORIENTATION=-